MRRNARLTKRWPALICMCLAPLVAINLAVAAVGHTVIFPLSPHALGAKVRALGSYAAHLPRCWWSGHVDIDAAIERAGRRHKLPPGLLAALVAVESEGRAHRISPSGAMGAAQLMPDTAKQLGVGDPFDTAASVDGGARYLATQLAHFRDVRLALSAYNAGPGAVDRVVPRNGETEHYVRKVMATYARLRPRG